MAQHDYVIDNSTGANVRADINSALLAISSNNSGSSAPSTTYALQSFANTTDSMLQLRNAANNAFVNLRKFDGSLPLPDGSAASPSLFFDDDTNTGIFSSAADTINFATAGVERIKIGAGGYVLDLTGINGFDDVFRITGDGTNIGPRINLTPTNSGIPRINGTANALQLQTIGNAALHIDSSQRTGIGTTSPQAKFHVSDTYHFTVAGGNTTTGMQIGNYDGSSFGVLTIRASSHRFDISGTAKAILDSNGRLVVGTTNAANFTNNAVEFFNTTVDATVGIRTSANASGQDFISFKFGSGPSACGGIRRASTTQGPEFFSNSDRRIKTNILDMDNTLDKINQLSLKKFDFVDGYGSGVGLIAQDLIKIFPNKVKKDASDDGTGDTVPDGVEPWTVGHNFTFELLKAIQELSAKVEALEAA